MADWLPEDHLAWFVLDVVAQLDTTAFHAARRTGGPGRQGYDPVMLLGLLLYAYAVGERSSRRIERLCLDHVAFRVLCAQDAPDHTTIARFRSENESAFADVFAQVLRLCAAAGMVKVGTVALDGTKIAANASRGANRTEDTVRAEAARIAEQVVAEAAAVDAAEDTDGGDGGGLPPGFESRGGRAANIKKALEELDRQDAEHREADRADRDRAEEYLRRVETHQPVTRPPANVDPVRLQQARVARERRRIADLEGVRGAEASSRRRDARRILKQAEQALASAEEQASAGTNDMRGRAERRRDQREARARARGGTGRSVNLTDPDSRLMRHGGGGGSVQGFNAQIVVTDDHLILGCHLSQDANDSNCWTPTLESALEVAEGLGIEVGTVLADAGYFTEANLTAEGPDRLIAPGKNRDLALQAKETPATGPPPDEASPADRMRHRLRTAEGHQSYKRRSATVETVIAHLKDQTGLRRFSRRGITAAAAELDLAATVVNLRRLHSVMAT